MSRLFYMPSKRKAAKASRPGTSKTAVRAASRKNSRKKSGRSNPGYEAVAEEYAGFHGRPSDEQVIVRTPIEFDLNLWGLGELVKLVMKTEDGRAHVTLKNFGGTILASNKKRNQLFIEGGDQSVDLAQFGIADPHETEVLGKVHRVYYYTVKDHLGDDGGEAIYNHRFGGRRPASQLNPSRRGSLRYFSLTGKRKVKVNGHSRLVVSKPPTLIYDTRNKLLSFSGGGYVIPDEGIDG